MLLCGAFRHWQTATDMQGSRRLNVLCGHDRLSVLLGHDQREITNS